MKLLLVTFALLIIAFPLVLLIPREAHATLYPVTVLSPDGHTRLFSDGTAVMIYHLDDDGNIVQTIEVHEAGIFSFTFMDNQSALMNREDYGVLILNVSTGQVFWLGYSYPDGYCDPCNIGGQG